MKIERRNQPVRASLRLPGDKSISHRLLLLAALRRSETVIGNLAESEDLGATMRLVEAVGSRIESKSGMTVVSRQDHQALPPEQTIECGNSGTTARIGSGILATEGSPGTPRHFTLLGDSSLRRRPMERVVLPLSAMGADIGATDGRLPLRVGGNGKLRGASEAFPVTSAQVAGAIAYAALRCRRPTVLRERREMRDHTERLFASSGVVVSRPSADPDAIVIHPGVPDVPSQWDVPGDASSAAFLIAAALLIPGSQLQLDGVGLNATRSCHLRLLAQSGGELDWWITRGYSWEPSGSIVARYSPRLRGFQITPDSRPAVSLMMDELPVLLLLATQASGTTRITGAEELRVKESDRIATTVRMFHQLGLHVEELHDGFRTHGPQSVSGGGGIDAGGDHRLAMTAAIAGLLAEAPIDIRGADCVSSSWPHFWDVLHSL